MRNRWSLAVGILTMCCAAAAPGSARADGGMLRTSQQVGLYRIAVFTDPTPLRVGPVDVSAWIQESSGEELVEGIEVRLTAIHADSGERIDARMTRKAATNKLMRAAQLDLPAGGIWRFSVAVGRPGSDQLDLASTRFDAMAGPPPPRWRELAVWLLWPTVPIALFGWHVARTAWQKPPCCPPPHNSLPARQSDRIHA